MTDIEKLCVVLLCSFLSCQGAFIAGLALTGFEHIIRLIRKFILKKRAEKQIIKQLQDESKIDSDDK